MMIDTSSLYYRLVSKVKTAGNPRPAPADMYSRMFFFDEVMFAAIEAIERTKARIG